MKKTDWIFLRASYKNKKARLFSRALLYEWVSKYRETKFPYTILKINFSIWKNILKNFIHILILSVDNSDVFLLIANHFLIELFCFWMMIRIEHKNCTHWSSCCHCVSCIAIYRREWIILLQCFSYPSLIH